MPISRRRKVAVLAALALVGSGPAVAEAPPLRVLATVAMAADVARHVAGGCAEVDTLLGAGADPHLYRATAGDVARLSRAELILYVDPALEARLAEVLARFADRTPTIGLLRAALPPALLLGHPDDPAAVDPHVWMDVSLWARVAPVIAEAVLAQRPDCAAAVGAATADYLAQLDALHDWAGRAMASIPPGGRRLVTAHDAFGYFARAYGVEASEAVQGISTDSEASIADIRAVARFVADNRVPAVFVESTINPRTVEALVAEARSMGHEVRIGGALYADAMGEAGTPAASYIGMIWHNVATIVAALGGAVPPPPDALRPWAQAQGLID